MARVTAFQLPDFKLPDYQILNGRNRTNLIVEPEWFYEARDNNMIPNRSKDKIRQRIHSRLRQRLQGSPERPRLNVYRSTNHIYVQVIDDTTGVTLAEASTARGKGEAKRNAGNLAPPQQNPKPIPHRAKKK